MSVEWGASSVGRALRSQRRGRGFNSPALHLLYFCQWPAAVIPHNPRLLPPSGSTPYHLAHGWSAIVFPNRLLRASCALAIWSCGVAARLPTSVLNRSFKFGSLVITLSALAVLAWS